MSRPGILDALNHQDFGYRWVTRFIALDKTDATKALTKLRRQWFNKRKSITALLREVMYNQPAQLLDSDADNKVVDADLALQALGGDHVAFGYLTTTITVSDADRARAEEKVRARRADRQRPRLHHHPRGRQRGRGVAVVAARPGLRQCPPAAGPHAQSRASDAAVVGLGRAGAQRASRRAAAALCADQRLDAVPAVDPCRRCRPHAGRRPDRRRQVGAARADRAAVPALCRMPRSTSSTRAIRRAPRCWRWAARITRSARRGQRQRRWRSSRCAGSTMTPSAAWAAEWIAALLAHEKVAGHARGQGRGLVGARQPRIGAARGAHADRPRPAAPVERAAHRAQRLYARRPLRPAARRRRTDVSRSPMSSASRPRR